MASPQNDSSGRSPEIRRGRSEGDSFGTMFLWGPVVAWAVVIVTLTSVPQSGGQLIPIPHFDLVVHAGIYGALGFFLLRAFFWGTALGPRGIAWLPAFAIGQFYGILDELHQLLIPTRFCDLNDVMADGVGVILGMLAYHLFFIRPKRSNSTDTTG